MSETCTISLAEAKYTQYAGRSLVSTLYALPCTVFLSGELGAGKTTFLQGFAKGLGILEPVTSPTFALEQGYATDQIGEFLHVDLYRLKEKDALRLFHQSDHHTGVRCIEWPERLGNEWEEECDIYIHLRDTGNERLLTCAFNDIPLPSRKDIEDWRAMVMLPVHVAAHCDAVADFADTLAKKLVVERCMIIRSLALRRGAEVHDLFRFLDFRAINMPSELSQTTDAQQECWKQWKERYPEMKHEAACAAFLREHGYDALASIVETHGLTLPNIERKSIEQKLLFYADKRVALSTVVTLEERFADFAMRYGNGKETEQGKVWYEETKKLEKELLL